MTNIEKISAYLENEMTESQRKAFEKSVANDPELKREFSLQQDIIEGLKQARANQLKSLLNNVQVGGAGISELFTFGNIAAVAALIGLFSFGVYYVIDNNKITDTDSETIIENVLEDEDNSQENDSVVSHLSTSEEPELITSENVTAQVEDKQKKNIDQSAQKAKPQQTSTEETTQTDSQKTADEPVIKRPTAAPMFETSDVDSLEAPSNVMGDHISNASATLDVEIDDSKKKYDFHYQFNNSKLILFGNFNNGLYEILEFKTNSEKSLFLYYKDKFYPLNRKQVHIKELQPVKDKSLIEKLEKVTGS